MSETDFMIKELLHAKSFAYIFLPNLDKLMNKLVNQNKEFEIRQQFLGFGLLFIIILQPIWKNTGTGLPPLIFINRLKSNS